MFIDEKLCLRCKGKLLCGLKKCPIYERINRFKTLKLRQEVEAPSPPNYMISWKNYPRVAVGPNLIFKLQPKNPYKLSLEEFVSFRANQLRTFQVKGIRHSEETALSIKPVQFDVKLKNIIGQVNSPNGITASAEKITPQETKIPGKIYSLVDNYDLKANQALLKIKKYGFNYMVQALSTGNLGIKTQRKLVPTRWAITAVDSTLAKDYFLKIRSLPPIRDIELHTSIHWDNHFHVILFPWGWGFEMLEQWYKGSIVHDNEYSRLKKDYAKNITGAYYATRLEVLKYLEQKRRCALAIVIRQVGDKYIYPVGVWHIRDAIRVALENKAEKFNSLSDLEMRLKEKMNFNDWKGKSELWKIITQQKQLNEFT